MCRKDATGIGIEIWLPNLRNIYNNKKKNRSLNDSKQWR